jgi:hypothetical protein
VIEKEKGMATFKQFVAENPHTGTAEQVVTLSIGIAAAADCLSPTTLSIYRDASALGEKVFSKLKVIGERLGQLDDKTRREVIRGLPASYSTIHLLCALKPDELATAVKTKQVTPKTSVRAATTYVKQVRFPRQSLGGKDVEKGRWSIKEETLYRVCRPEDSPLSEDLQRQLEDDLRRVCSCYGMDIRKASNESTTALREADRKEKAAFWREVLEKQLPQSWFQETDREVRKTFNLKIVEEVWDAPLRTFTGFLIRTGKGRQHFYEEHGQAYIAKLHYLQETTESRTNRYNLKRRIEEVLAHEESARLVIWRNVVLKNSGLL